MKCQLCKKYMYSYYDDEISLQLKLEIENHLKACTSCRLQYDLTLAENQVLRNTSDIPLISPDFNERVINAINSDKQLNMTNNAAVISKNNWLHFRWSSIYGKSAVAVAVLLLTLYLYLPGVFTYRQQHQIAKNDQPLVTQRSAVVDSVDITCGSKPMKEKNEHLSKVGNNDISESMQSDIIYGEANSTSNTPQNNMEVAIPQLCDGTRMVPSEVGRSERKVITSNNPVSSLILKNIPDKYKLISQVNCAENQMDYSYQTADGSETISIKLMDSAGQDQAIVSENNSTNENEVSDRLMSAAAPAAAENISREIQVGDKNFTVLISGNISSDELNVLANTLIVCTDPNI